MSKRQTVFFRSVDPLNKEHRDPNKIDLEAPRLAWLPSREVRENIKTRCIGLTSNMLKRKDLSSIKHDRTQSHTPSLSYSESIPKAVIMETGVITYEKVFASPRPPPKISFQDNWIKELGSEVAGGSEDYQQTEPKSKTQLLGTERPVNSCVPVFVEHLDEDKTQTKTWTQIK